MIKQKVSIFDNQAINLLKDVSIDKSKTQIELEKYLASINDPEQNLIHESQSDSDDNEKTITCQYCNIILKIDNYRDHCKIEDHIKNVKLYSSKIQEDENYKPMDGVKKFGEKYSVEVEGFEVDCLNKLDIQRSQKIFLRTAPPENQLISIYRHILCPKGELPAHAELLQRLQKILTKNFKVSIILHQGGHFAIALYENNICIKHKTFRAYIVRQKGGGVQSLADKRQSAHKSAGANMRRQNQVHFEEKITKLLADWKTEGLFDNLDLKLFHVPYYTRKIYFNENAFNKEDENVRSIPFSTVKPGLTEAKRVFTELFSLCIWKRDQDENSTLKILTQESVLDINKRRKFEFYNQKKLKKQESSSDEYEDYNPFSFEFTAKVPKPNISEQGGLDITNCLEKLEPRKVKASRRRIKDKIDRKNLQISDQESNSSLVIENFEDLNITKLSPSCIRRLSPKPRSRRNSKNSNKSESDDISVFQICSNGNVEKIDFLCQTIPVSIWINCSLDRGNKMPLHVATRAGNLGIIDKLLQLGANPELIDDEGLVPYQCAMNKSIRNVFRLFRYSNESKWDWDKAKVDPAISQEQLDKQKLTKNRKSNEKKKAAKLKKDAEEKAKKLAEIEAEKERKMTPEEKERQKRLRAIEKRMGWKAGTHSKV